MISLVEIVKNFVDDSCLSRAMKKKVGKRYCEVDMSDQEGKWVVIDLDKEGSLVDLQSLRPDFVFVCDNPTGGGIVVVVEISMGKNKSESDVKRQIQAGFNNLEERIYKTSDQSVIKKINAVGLFCGNPTKEMRNKLSNTRVRFGNKNIMIKILNCGRKLNEVL